MSVLEVLMIVCFGLAWPINLYNSWKSRSTKGKNLLFMSFIVLAYIFGILNKLLVSVDGAVYFLNRRKEIRQGICSSYTRVLR